MHCNLLKYVALVSEKWLCQRVISFPQYAKNQNDKFDRDLLHMIVGK